MGERERERKSQKSEGQFSMRTGQVCVCVCVCEITMLIVTTACPLQLSPLSPSRVQRLSFVFLLRCARFMACYIILLPRHACHMLPSASVCAASASASCCCLSCNQLPVSRDSNRFNHWKRNWNRTCDCDWGCCCCSCCQKKGDCATILPKFLLPLVSICCCCSHFGTYFSRLGNFCMQLPCVLDQSRELWAPRRGSSGEGCTRDMREESALHCGPYPEYACTLRTALTMGGFCWDFKLVFFDIDRNRFYSEHKPN